MFKTKTLLLGRPFAFNNQQVSRSKPENHCLLWEAQFLWPREMCHGAPVPSAKVLGGPPLLQHSSVFHRSFCPQLQDCAAQPGGRRAVKVTIPLGEGTGAVVGGGEVRGGELPSKEPVLIQYTKVKLGERLRTKGTKQSLLCLHTFSRRLIL